MESILELRDLTKRYGHVTAVDHLTLSVPRGSIFGLLGPNGAGKSTTIRMIMQILGSDSGEILLDGRPVDEERRRQIGYLPEERGLYKRMRVLDHLIFIGTLRGLSAAESRGRADAWLERLELADRAGDKIETLSKGMQQKVQFIGTVLHNPDLLILDEPFSGLDPINTREIKDLLLAMAEDGVTVVLSTHVLPQVEELCGDICLINRARPILQGSLAQIRRDRSRSTWAMRTDIKPARIAAVGGVASVRKLDDQLLIELADELAEKRSFRRLLGALLEMGTVESFTRLAPDLESIFIRAVEEDQGHAG